MTLALSARLQSINVVVKIKIIIIDGVDFVSHVFVKVEVGSTLG